MDQLHEIANSPTSKDLRLGTWKAKFKTILVGVNFSGPMATALNAAKSLADEFKGTLIPGACRSSCAVWSWSYTRVVGSGSGRRSSPNGSRYFQGSIRINSTSYCD